MAKQTFTAGQVLTAAEMNSLQENDYNWTVTTKTASYTLAAGDEGTRIVMNNAGATTITVDDSVFAAGDVVWLHNIGAGTCTVTAGTATVNTAGSLELAQWGGGALYFTSASTAIFFPAGGGVSGIEIDFLIIGGGGSGRGTHGGGGGAGGYLTSYSTDISGGGGPNLDAFRAETGTNYVVHIGAGGPGGGSGVKSYGSGSLFGLIGAMGGGGADQVGGSGGGGTVTGSGEAGILDQGYAGGAGAPAPDYTGGGGGGAGGAGQAATAGGGGIGGTGGAGLTSNITGSAVTRAGGGGGGNDSTGTKGVGGSGGGGNGGDSTIAATSGTVNTGSGGGGGGNSPVSVNGGNGGSGIVILRYPNTYTITLGAGLTGSTATDGSDKVTTITAGTDYVSWS